MAQNIIDWGLYFYSFKTKTFWRCILLLALGYIAINIFNQLYSSDLLKLLSKFPKTQVTNIIFLILFTYSIIHLVKKIKRGNFPDINSVAVASTFCLLYFFLVRSNPKYYFFSFRHWNISFIYYADVLFTSLLLIFIEYRRYYKKLRIQTTSSLIEDEPNPKSYIDLHSRESYAEHICSFINSTSTNNSFSIAVVADWGHGKSDFLMRLKDNLERNSNNEVIDFNPWKKSEIGNLTEIFFTELSTSLSKYNSSIANQLKNYTKKLFQSSKEFPQKIFDASIDIFFVEQSIKKRFEDLAKMISSTGKRIIVTIDDVDRLTGNEALEVLRLIRNTANFPNTFYIVGLDQKYITETIKKTNTISNEDAYLKKIFQLVINLPSIKLQNLTAELRSILNLKEMDNEHRDSIEIALSFLSTDRQSYAHSLLPDDKSQIATEHFFNNSRDIKRFTNSFKVAFEKLKHDVDIIDLFTLELIRITDQTVYQHLLDKTLVKFNNSSPYTYEFNEMEFDKLYHSNSIYRNKLLKNSLKFLFSSKLKNSRRISDSNNYFLYFSYQLENFIPLKQFHNTLSQSLNDISTQFDRWINEGKILDLRNALLLFEGYTNPAEFAKYIIICFKYGLEQNIIRSLHSGERTLNKGLFRTKTDYHKFIDSIIGNTAISIINRARLANEFLRDYVYQRGSNFKSRTSWQAIIYHLFDDYLRNHDIYDSSVYDFFLLNDQERTPNERKIILNPLAHSRLRAYLIEKHDRLAMFLKFLIRPYGTPPDGSFTFEPFAKDIFISETGLKEIVYDLKSKDDSLLKIRQIILDNFEKVYKHGFFKLRKYSEDYYFLLNHAYDMGIISEADRNIAFDKDRI